MSCLEFNLAIRHSFFNISLTLIKMINVGKNRLTNAFINFICINVHYICELTMTIEVYFSLETSNSWTDKYRT